MFNFGESFWAILCIVGLSFMILGALPTAQQARDAWQAGVARSGQKWADGINGITDNPLVKAADKKQVWLQRIQAAADKWEKNLRAINFQTWKAETMKNGQANYTNGANKGASKYLSFAQKFLPYLESGIRQVKDMPNGTLEQRIQRAVFMMNYNAKFPG